MPRMRIRTTEGERVVGTSNCSVLSVTLAAHAQRHTLQLRADAKLTAGDTVLEHVSWEWPELSDATTVELISEPSVDPFAGYDPPDAQHISKGAIAVDLEQQRASELDYRAAQRELLGAVKQLAGITGRAIPFAQPPDDQLDAELRSAYCSFCGKGHAEVRKLVAGPAVFICDACVQIASQVLAD